MHNCVLLLPKSAALLLLLLLLLLLVWGQGRKDANVEDAWIRVRLDHAPLNGLLRCLLRHEFREKSVCPLLGSGGIRGRIWSIDE